MDASNRRRLFRDLRRAGWTIRPSGSGHLQIRNPAGRLVTTTASTPSDWRNARNLLRDLRHGGFHWPRKGQAA